jgi:hypothetical protein
MPALYLSHICNILKTVTVQECHLKFSRCLYKSVARSVNNNTCIQIGTLQARQYCRIQTGTWDVPRHTDLSHRQLYCVLVTWQQHELSPLL